MKNQATKFIEQMISFWVLPLQIYSSSTLSYPMQCQIASDIGTHLVLVCGEQKVFLS